MKRIHIGLLGLGNVGAGVMRILHANAPVIRERLGPAAVLSLVDDREIIVGLECSTCEIKRPVLAVYIYAGRLKENRVQLCMLR